MAMIKGCENSSGPNSNPANKAQPENDCLRKSIPVPLFGNELRTGFLERSLSLNPLGQLRRKEAVPPVRGLDHHLKDNVYGTENVRRICLELFQDA